jgi:hypothetical protein
VKAWDYARLLVWVSALPVLGQDAPTGSHFELKGTVFDSIIGAPLAGAMVHVAARDTARVPFVAVTDSLGRFVLRDLPSGAFVVGFYHDNLTVLGLDAPLAVVELGTEPVVTVNLWIPSVPVVRALRCGGDKSDNVGGMLVGFLREAESGLAVRETVLRLSWRALALDSANYRTVTERATAQISADGSFLACRLPVDATLDVEVSAPGRRTLTGSVVYIPASGLARLDIALADTLQVHGTSLIRGRVRTPSGKVVTTGQAVIDALGRMAPIRDGEFLLSEVPAGSWIVDARVIGSEPQSALVTVSDGATTVVQMRAGESLQRLEAVTIVGKRDANTRLLEEVLRRKRLGLGTVFLPSSPALKSATFTSDVMREARGFQYRGPTNIEGRTRCKFVAVYVDDVLQPDGISGLNAVWPREVLAIETFADILLAPVKYRIMKTVLGTADKKYCAVILVWTRHRAGL